MMPFNNLAEFENLSFKKKFQKIFPTKKLKIKETLIIINKSEQKRDKLQCQQIIIREAKNTNFQN